MTEKHKTLYTRRSHFSLKPHQLFYTQNTTHQFLFRDDHLGSGRLEEDHAQADHGAHADAVLEAPEDAGEEGGHEGDQVQTCRRERAGEVG